MKLNIPFFKQNTETSCGPTALKMVLSHLGKEFDEETILKKTNATVGKAVSTIQLAVAAKKLGFNPKVFSKKAEPDSSNWEMKYYKEKGDAFDKIIEGFKEAESLKIPIEEKIVSQDELLENLKEDSGIIVLLDWNVVTSQESKGYQGHFAPIVGYDNENVYVHNSGSKDPRPFYKISRETFEKARKAKGTDEDILIITK